VNKSFFSVEQEDIEKRKEKKSRERSPKKKASAGRTNDTIRPTKLQAWFQYLAFFSSSSFSAPTGQKPKMGTRPSFSKGRDQRSPSLLLIPTKRRREKPEQIVETNGSWQPGENRLRCAATHHGSCTAPETDLEGTETLYW